MVYWAYFRVLTQNSCHNITYLPILGGMQGDLRIELAQLIEGQTRKIQGSFHPSCLAVQEEELIFIDPVEVEGEVSLRDGHVVVLLSASTQARMPCAICNEMAPCPLRVVQFRYAEPLSSLSGPLLDLALLLRESLLLELPKTVECHEGHCPNRALLTAYRTDRQRNDDHYFPFAKM